MTGVAAQICGDASVVESLGYKVDAGGTISQQETDENGRTSGLLSLSSGLDGRS